MTEQEFIDRVKQAAGEWVVCHRRGPSGVLDVLGGLEQLNELCEGNGMEFRRDFDTKGYELRLQQA